MLPLALMIVAISFMLPTGLAQAQEEEGVVTVRILYRGSVPPPQEIEITRDAEFCGATAVIHPVMVHSTSGGLKDAVVTIEGLPSLKTPEPKSAIIANTRCRFMSHVISTQAGATIEIHNQDPIMHNTHIVNNLRTFLNVAMVPNGRPVVKKVEKPGVYLVQCDAHKFMRGYVVVSEQPYIGLSDELGYARILHVPVGTHAISVWHESLGELHAQVTVPSNREASVTVEFPGNMAAPSR